MTQADSLYMFYSRILGYDYDIFLCKKEKNDYYIIVYGSGSCEDWEIHLMSDYSWISIPDRFYK